MSIKSNEVFKIKDLFLNHSFNKEKLWKFETTELREVDINKFTNKRYTLPIADDKNLILKDKAKHIVFPTNIREDIAHNFRLYMIQRTSESGSNNDKGFIQKFELNGINILFYKEGLSEMGIKKEDIDNEIGQSKDQQIDISQTMNKSFGR